MKIVLIFLLFLILWGGLYSQTFQFGESLYTIKTKHFDIIYPKASEKTAFRLAGMADGIFEEITSLLSYTNSRRIPVVISPDPGYFNGLTSPVPYIHIILQDYPPDGEYFDFSDTVKTLFTHELTHAITMDIKSPFCDFMYGIFGAPFAFGLALEPFYMVEGSAVSFESRYGFGRANDPMIQEALREDIYENEFLSPLQASGSMDVYPYSYSFYYYGGLFNKYLQDRFGMAMYARYWHSMADLGLGTNITLTEDDNWYYSCFFEAAFGLPLKKLWADFKNSLTVIDVTDNPEALSSCYHSISSPVYSGGKIYFIDSFKVRVMSYTISSGKYETVIDNASGMDDIDVSPDGRLMLVSLYTYQNGFYGRKVLYYDLIKKIYLGISLDGLYGAHFSGKGIIALKAGTHKNILVYSEGGRVENLLEGSDTSVFAPPVALDGGRIAFIMTDNGMKKLMIFDPATHALSVVKTPAGVRVDYIRYLSGTGGGRLLFCYNSSHEFYRLAVLDGGRMQLQTNNFAGGVFYPVTDGDSVFYTGKFSKGDKLMKYPYKLQDIAGTNVTATMTGYDGSGAAVTGEAVSGAAETNGLKAENYSPLNYFSPFQCWLILPASISCPGGKYYTLDSVGAYSIVADPVDENTLYLGLGYNYIENFANLWGQWNYYGGFPVSFTLNALDNMDFDWQNYSYYRQSSLSLNLNYTANLLPANNYLVFGAGASYVSEAPDPGVLSSPYYWPFTYASAIISGSAGFSTLLYTDLIYEQRGMAFMSYIDYSLVYQLYKTEGSLTFALPFIRSVIYLYGAYSPQPVFSASGWDPYFGGNHYPAFREFAAEPFESDYYSSGELSLLIFSMELQNGWFPVYFNRLFITTGYRGIYIEENYCQSVYTRIDLQLSAPAGGLAGSLGGLFAEAAYNITADVYYISGGFYYNFSTAE